MKSFDEWFGEASQDKLFWESPSKASKMGFEAGQQSKQAEVDELRKRIDEVVKKLQLIKADTLRPSHYDYDKGWRDCAITALNDLKGDQS